MLKQLSVALACVALPLSACGGGGVDREGTRDLFVRSLEEQGFTADGDCVDRVFDEYSDDQLKEANDALGEGNPSPIATELTEKLIGCVDLGDLEGG